MNRRLPIVALALSGLLWGTTVPLSKTAVAWAGPGWLTALRFALAAPVLAWAVRGRLREVLTPPLLLSGAAGYGLVILLQNAGIARTSATHAAILVGALPAMVAMLVAALGRARVGAVAAGGFAVALAGVALVAGGGDPGGDLAGDGLVVVSLAVAAGFTVLQPRLLAGRDAAGVVVATAGQLAGAALASVLAAGLLEGLPPIPRGAADLASLGALVVLGTLVPFTLFAFGQSRVVPEVAGAFLNLEPLVGTAAGVVFLGDAFGWHQGVGGAAILLGIVLSAGVGLRGPQRVSSEAESSYDDAQYVGARARRAAGPGAGYHRGASAEADGNRTRLAEILGHVGFEDRGGHQAP
jgi:O-acetylserine/cysteine efflux transporter